MFNNGTANTPFRPASSYNDAEGLLNGNAIASRNLALRQRHSILGNSTTARPLNVVAVILLGILCGYLCFAAYEAVNKSYSKCLGECRGESGVGLFNCMGNCLFKDITPGEGWLTFFELVGCAMCMCLVLVAVTRNPGTLKLCEKVVERIVGKFF